LDLSNGSSKLALRRLLRACGSVWGAPGVAQENR